MTNRPARSRLAAAAVLVLAAGLVPLALAGGSGKRTATTPASIPNFARDVAPIVRDTCVGCHTDGGIAPFAFRTEADVSTRAAAVLRALEARRMPPWMPGPSSPLYLGQGDRALDARERTTLVRWAKAQLATPGAPRGRTPIGTPKFADAAARPGEQTLSLPMPTPYRPSATGGGTDDYRCFLLDPGLTTDSFVTSARIAPGQTKVVHHVILFRVLPNAVADAEEFDRGTKGQGWTCFGGPGVRQGSTSGGGSVIAGLDDAGWISAWAPGNAGNRFREGTGVSLPAGSRVVMQVHYNLLNGSDPDLTRAVFTTVPATEGLTPVVTTLLPAPVELPCAKSESGPLCDRIAAQFDQVKRFGQDAALAPAGLLLLCGKNAQNPAAGETTYCDRPVAKPTTIHAVGGHMHLLGRSIRVELNPGTPGAKLLLDIPRWDFHWQSVYPLVEPVTAKLGDVVRVTCRHDAALRAGILPKLKPRYTLWGEGTTDEMCLGILLVTRP
ncbi:MAG: monooxygenase [Thermoleophilia bacterium]|nr:monooxygenase [Thermoleophilia bacterium]